MSNVITVDKALPATQKAAYAILNDDKPGTDDEVQITRFNLTIDKDQAVDLLEVLDGVGTNNQRAQALKAAIGEVPNDGKVHHVVVEELQNLWILGKDVDGDGDIEYGSGDEVTAMHYHHEYFSAVDPQQC